MGRDNSFHIFVECGNDYSGLSYYLISVAKLMQGRDWAITVAFNSSEDLDSWQVVAPKLGAKKTNYVVGGIKELATKAAQYSEKYKYGWLVSQGLLDRADLGLLHSAPFPVYKLFPESLSEDFWPRTSVCVAVVTHTPYLKYLKECILSIDNQSVSPSEKILICDGCQPPDWLDSTWTIVSGEWGTPNPGRNQATNLTKSDWIVFFDADNVMPDNYLAWMNAAIACTANNVAFIYPDIQYCDRKLRPKRFLETYEWHYWWARIQTCYDTSSAWRISALKTVGGFDEELPCYDDYGLVLALSNIGWQGMKLGTYMLMREHDSSIRRSTKSHYFNDGKREDALWKIRTFAIVTVFAGRTKYLDQWKDFLLQADLPDKVALYVLDNSGNAGFSKVLQTACQQLSNRFTHVDYSKKGEPFQESVREGHVGNLRHRHVGNLYNYVLPRISEDFLYILEDDILPDLGALRKLAFSLKPNNNIAAIGAAYRSAASPNHVCASTSRDYWNKVPLYDKLPSTLMEVGFLGAGCTLYSNNALKAALPVMSFSLKGHYTGWDGYLSNELRKLGYRLWLHGGVRCSHNGLKA